MEGSNGEIHQVNTTTTTSEPEIAIEIEKESWKDSVRRRVKASFVHKWRKEPCSIFRVPANIRKLHPEAYEPRVVSIGPYHHGKAHLEPMEKHKWRIIGRLLSRRRGEEDVLLGECLDKAKELEERARSCYSEVIGMNSNEFTEMMVLDGCFLIGVLLRERSETINKKNENKVTVEDDWAWDEQKDEEEERGAMHSSLWLLDHIDHDLLRVENQMPFFVVEALFDLLVLQPDDRPSASIYDLAMNLLNRFEPSDTYDATLKNPKSVHHLFHLYYEMVVGYNDSDDDTEKSSFSSVQERINLIDRGFLKIKKTTQGFLHHLRDAMPITFPRNKDSVGKKELSSSWIKSAKELEEAGVKFVVKKDASFLDLSFEGGVMKFPTLHIYEHTMILFRNLIAFEQCYLYTKDHIALYAMFMDCLIDTPTDVKVLQREEILRVGISSEKEVAQFFNNLNREVYFDNNDSYLGDMIVDVNRYCNSKTHKWRAVLARDYFNSPWAVISVVAAFILLGLTLLQTFYTLYAYYHPPS